MPRIATSPLRGSSVVASVFSNRGSVSERFQQVAADDGAFADYRPSVAFLFPGQGAQKIGMAKVIAVFDKWRRRFLSQDVVETVPAAKELFDRATAILGYDLYQICVEGPKEKLDSTVVSQPALFVSSLAAVEKLKAQHGEVHPAAMTNT